MELVPTPWISYTHAAPSRRVAGWVASPSAPRRTEKIGEVGLARADFRGRAAPPTLRAEAQALWRQAKVRVLEGGGVELRTMTRDDVSAITPSTTSSMRATISYLGRSRSWIRQARSVLSSRCANTVKGRHGRRACYGDIHRKVSRKTVRTRKFTGSRSPNTAATGAWSLGRAWSTSLQSEGSSAWAMLLREASSTAR